MNHALTSDNFPFFVMADSAKKFLNSLYISGWSLTKHDPLVEIHVVGITKETSIVSIQDSHPNIEVAQAFQIQVLFNFDFCHDIEVVLKTLSSLVVRRTVGDLIDQRASNHPSKNAVEVFRAKVNAIPNARILDIGGRDRSQRTYNEFSLMMNTLSWT